MWDNFDRVFVELDLDVIVVTTSHFTVKIKGDETDDEEVQEEV